LRKVRYLLYFSLYFLVLSFELVEEFVALADEGVFFVEHQICKHVQGFDDICRF
jgi:hypothetical protein